MSITHFEMASPLVPEECAARLSASINVPPDGYDRLWNGSGQAALYGEVGVDHLSIYVKMGGNSPRTTANATMNASATGTMITGQCELDAGYRAWQWMVMGSAVFIGLPIIWILFNDWRAGAIHQFTDLLNSGYATEVIGLVMIFHFNVNNWMMRSQSRFVANFLHDFLMRTLEARPVFPMPQ